MIALLTTLLLAMLAWSFSAALGIIVQAQGQLGPEADERLLFAPIEGQLAYFYIVEGAPVAAGDVVARVNALGAMQLAASALLAQLKLQATETAFRTFPVQKRALEKGIELIQFQIESAEEVDNLRISQGMTQLAADQRLKLERARLKLDGAQDALAFTRNDYEKHRRLFESPGGGGIARSKVEEKFKEYQGKIAEFEIAKNELAEFEVKLNEEYAKRQEELKALRSACCSTMPSWRNARPSSPTPNGRTRSLSSWPRRRPPPPPRSASTTSTRTTCCSSRPRWPGYPSTGSASHSARRQDRSQGPARRHRPGRCPDHAAHRDPGAGSRLSPGGHAGQDQVQRLPLQRFGFIDGVLEFIAPSVSTAGENPQNRVQVYRGRVSLERDYFTSPETGARIPLRFGMIAIAEIMVQQRRLLDLALDPLRGASG